MTSASILINNYNYGRFVAGAIESALSQRYDPVEVVVVDDGSTDESPEVIRRYPPRVHAIFKQNGGQASAFNAGFAACQGDVVCLLDADDRFHPDKIERIVAVFAANPDAAWCFHRIERIDEAGENVESSRQRGSGRRDLRRWLQLGWLPFFAPPTSGLCFRRTLLEQILPMPEQPGIAVSDNYLKIVAMSLAAGYFLDEALTTMLVHGHNLSHSEIEETRLQAHRFISLATQLRHTHAPLRLFANRRFAKGLNRFRTLRPHPADLERMVAAYLAACTPLERVVIDILARLVPFRQGR